MAMGKRGPQQGGLWIPTRDLARGPGHAFYERLNEVLLKHEFEPFVEKACRGFYADKVGRPSLPPAVYFRMLLIGYFEGLDSERGIAWRVADSMSLREFLGYSLADAVADHSTISRNRRLIDIEAHQEVFAWILQALAKEQLLRGKTLGVDATTLEANAAMKSIVRRDTGEAYQEFLRRLAQASGIETPTREDLARLDRKRAKKGSNDDWTNPHDPDAKITKMKDGRTHLAHKAEHVVDMETGAIVAVTVQPADRGDTTSLTETVEEAMAVIAEVMEDPQARAALSDQLFTEMVADKGYHSNAVLLAQDEVGLRTYIAEPKRKHRNWSKNRAAQAATYANRRRMRGARGKALHRRRAEFVERQFAHCFETGGMRRTHLRGHTNIRKRLLIHAGAFNLGLVLRKLLGAGTPRAFQGRLALLLGLLSSLLARLRRLSWLAKPSEPLLSHHLVT